MRRNLLGKCPWAPCGDRSWRRRLLASEMFQMWNSGFLLKDKASMTYLLHYIYLCNIYRYDRTPVLVRSVSTFSLICSWPHLQHSGPQGDLCLAPLYFIYSIVFSHIWGLRHFTLFTWVKDTTNDFKLPKGGRIERQTCNISN